MCTSKHVGMRMAGWHHDAESSNFAFFSDCASSHSSSAFRLAVVFAAVPLASASAFFFFFFTSPVRSLTSAFTGVAADDACELSS